MPISIVRLGSFRKSNEGIRLGTVRRPPRGVPKTEFAKQNYYDVWFPTLSPSAELVKVALQATNAKEWAAFERRFRTEMKAREAASALDLLAALSHRTNLSVGCYCENEERCHRSVLRKLLAERGAQFV